LLSVFLPSFSLSFFLYFFGTFLFWLCSFMNFNERLLPSIHLPVCLVCYAKYFCNKRHANLQCKNANISTRSSLFVIRFAFYSTASWNLNLAYFTWFLNMHFLFKQILCQLCKICCQLGQCANLAFVSIAKCSLTCRTLNSVGKQMLTLTYCMKFPRRRIS